MDLVAKKHADADVAAQEVAPRRSLPVIALALGASVACAGLFMTYVLAALLFPPLRDAQEVLAWLLPGFSFASIGYVLLGLAESFAWGLYGALLVGAVFNYLATRKR